MTLTPGTKLGPFEITSALGAGGMGEVYLARDTRLGRDVAIKVLPQHLSDNAEVRSRFEREAKTVSSLNHPHICTLFDVGREGETDYLVMELIEGETLAERLSKGALPTADVLRLGGQIADALDRAHRAGVIHRDLKPANVMLTKAGAKLMDFGLARATGLAGSGSGSGSTMAALTSSPTVAQALTAEGTIIGTFQYMSPEQLEGGETDARSDLWALGCVLYEMATGRRAFDGKSQASLIGSIMHTVPSPASQHAPMSPPALDQLVAACLAKDPADRVQCAHDVKFQLAWMAQSSVSGLAAPTLATVKRRPNWLPVGIAAAVGILATALVMTLLGCGGHGASGSAIAQRYSLGHANLSASSTPALAPDGTYAIFSASSGSSSQICRRDLASLEMTPIEGTEGGAAPFFSPDGEWIAFVTADAVKKVPAGGGLAQVIVTEPRVDAGAWGRDEMIYLTPRAGGSDGVTALARVASRGGTLERVATLDSTRSEVETWLPEIMPDGRTVLITVSDATGFHLIGIRPDGTRKAVVANAICGRFDASGRLVYFDTNSSAVLAAPFDPLKLELTGAAVPLTDAVRLQNLFALGREGTLLYVPEASAGSNTEVVWLDRKGKAMPAFETRGDWMQPRVSPDGKRVLLRKVGTSCELWVFDTERSALSRIVQDGDTHDAVWSPDGSRIAYDRTGAPAAMVTLTASGARETVTLAEGSERGAPQSWSRGGDLLTYVRSGRGTRQDIWIRPMDGSAPASAFLASPAREDQPAISSDGRFIAYRSGETGTDEIFVRPYPPTGTAWQISAGGGGSPVWSRDGRELYYLTGNKLMAVPVDIRAGFHAGAPVELFEGAIATARLRDYDAAPGGRFIAIRGTAGPAALPEIRVLLNWRSGLKSASRSGH